MKKLLFAIFMLLAARFAYADSLFNEGFEYANHDGQIPIGWICDDNSWLCGYLDKDHNRTAHTGNWYAYTDADDSWMFMEAYTNNQLKYRYYFWAISDGEYDVEFWLGNGSSAGAMTSLLFTKTVNGGEYLRFEEYIESISSNYQYFGIHAIAHEGAYHLTIDDIQIDMVNKYDLEVTPYRMDTTMMPGSQVAFHYTVQNTGYESLEIYMNGYSDYFSDITFRAAGQQANSFYTDGGDIVEAACYATLNPDIEMGTLCWLDIMFTVSCDCVTRMATIWAIAGHESVDEFNVTTMSIYPNPSSGVITIEGNGLVTITNVLGQEILKKEIVDKEIVALAKGVYFVRKDHGQATKIIVE